MKLPKNRIYPIIISLLTLAIGYLGFIQIKLKSINPAETYKVIKVLDGDSFITEEQHQNIRLFSVQAPELKYPFGEESKEFLTSKILGKEVYFKHIVAGKYGRIMALVYLDDLLINEVMVRQGFADYNGHPIKENPDLLKNAEKLAREEQLGIFGPDSTQTENLDNPQCTIKGNIRRGKKTYLFPGCRSYTLTIIEKHNGDQWFCSEKEAKKAGFIKPAACYGKSFKPDEN
ncbi:thermonuclease family protein [Patescibacteria group bacterium]|nr:thermonuclease family protein [Patescibacteria group bacterium]MBU1500153.1 thermonuclease family protein [Patescibacteria group bacterium]